MYVNYIHVCDWAQVVNVLKLRLNRSGTTRIRSLEGTIVGQSLLTSWSNSRLVRVPFLWWTRRLRLKKKKNYIHWVHVIRHMISTVGNSWCVQSFHFRYAAPEQYIMSTQTPSAPSVPVATALSPVLWQVKYFLLPIHGQLSRI